MAKDVVDEISSQFYNISNISVEKRVKSQEDGLITLEMILEVNNLTRIEETIKQIRCGDAFQYCGVVINYGNNNDRRLLASFIDIQLSFDLSASLLDTVNGFDFSDPVFEQALADALGISNTTDVTVISNGGDITIEATLKSLPGSDPTGEELLTTAQELQSNLTLVTQTLVDQLGALDSEVLSSSVDLCPPSRDCSGNGTCDPLTGVCECIGDWWGINCETACTCINGGQCVDAYCVCDFPYYGLRCDNVACDTCIV